MIYMKCQVLFLWKKKYNKNLQCLCFCFALLIVLYGLKSTIQFHQTKTKTTLKQEFFLPLCL